MLDCVVRDGFPLLHPPVIVAFANFFQVKDYPDSLMWAVPIVGGYVEYEQSSPSSNPA